MDIDNIIDMPQFAKARFTLEELREINRDMECIMRLTDSMDKAGPPLIRKPVSNIYPLRPDIDVPQF